MVQSFACWPFFKEIFILCKDWSSCTWIYRNINMRSWSLTLITSSLNLNFWSSILIWSSWSLISRSDQKSLILKICPPPGILVQDSWSPPNSRLVSIQTDLCQAAKNTLPCQSHVCGFDKDVATQPKCYFNMTSRGCWCWTMDMLIDVMISCNCKDKYSAFQNVLCWTPFE